MSLTRVIKMQEKETAKIVSDTADNLKVDPLTKSLAVMSVYIGAPDTSVKILEAGINSQETAKAEKEFQKPDQPLDYSPIERVIADMLQESTGTNILDSGGSYGRHWQRNRMITDFRKLKPLAVDVSSWKYSSGKKVRDVSSWKISFSLNIFHYLTSFLNLDEKTELWNKEFSEFCELPDNQDLGYPQLMEAFGDLLVERGDIESKGYGFSSYNGDSMLSQVIQGQYLGGEYPDYLILQIHQGCDVRGGYTKPRIFHVKDFEHMIMAENDLYASCKCLRGGSRSKRNLSLSSDDHGYHWYVDGSTGGLSEKWKDSLPPFWIVKKEKLYCSKCKSEPHFSASLDY